MSQLQKPLKILLIGDSCYDYYHYGKVNRISPEGPIPILDLEKVVKKYGMASNVYQNLQALGADVYIKTQFVENKRRFVDIKTGQQLLRVDEKLNDEDTPDGRIFKIEYDAEVIYSEYDLIVISDYDKGFVSDKTILSIRHLYDGPIFLDTKKRNLGAFKDIFIKINQLEYENTNYLPPDPQSLIVTYGSKKVVWGDKEFYPPKVDTYDVCGAGDTFLAALAFDYLHTKNMESAINFAMKASAITVKHSGVYAPTLEEIQNET
jgi:D-beta-D-heptose 7-phosphate kinase/D-beta-D-heptose 1-phosphate adenosyltransferase